MAYVLVIARGEGEYHSLYIYTHALASSTIRKSLTRDARIGGSGDGDDLWRPPSSSLSMYPCTTDYMYSALPSITTQKNEMGSAGAGVRF